MSAEHHTRLPMAIHPVCPDLDHGKLRHDLVPLTLSYQLCRGLEGLGRPDKDHGHKNTST